MTGNSFLARPRRALRWLILAGVGLAVITVAGLAIGTVLSSPRTPAHAGTLTHARVPGEATGIGSDGQPAVVPQKPLKLDAGASYSGGLSTGYPHTLTGAVSAAVEYASVTGSTLDPAAAASMAAKFADPSYRAAATQAAQGVTSDRQQMGLPVSGPVPQGASISFSPSEFQVRNVSADWVTVVLLGDLTETQPDGTSQIRLIVVPGSMHWDDGDWKLLPPGGNDYPGLSATPGTQAATALGWQPIAF